jgi:lysophospholipase
MRKYAELLYDLHAWGYDLVAYDHRGQGESQRLIADPLKGYVTKWQDYVGDLHQLIETVVKPKLSGGKIFLLSHSMGGGIAAEYLIEHPGTVAAMVTSSPMYAINLGMDESVAMGLLDTYIALGKGEDYAPSQSASDWQGTFAKQTITHSEARFGYAQDIRDTHVELRLAGATNRWVREGIRLTRIVRANADLLTTPTLILAAGEETKVLPTAEHYIAAAAPHARLIEFSKARHEIFMEKDAIRSTALSKTRKFFGR